MKKFSLFCLSLAILAVSCGKDVPEETGQQRPVVPGKQSSITIEGDSAVSTRATSDRVEFAGGYATGGGLYDGDADASVAAVPYSGYQLVSFSGGNFG